MNEKSSWRKWYEKNRERANELKRAQMRRARAEKPDFDDRVPDDFLPVGCDDWTQVMPI